MTRNAPGEELDIPPLGGWFTLRGFTVAAAISAMTALIQVALIAYALWGLDRSSLSAGVLWQIAAYGFLWNVVIYGALVPPVAWTMRFLRRPCFLAVVIVGLGGWAFRTMLHLLVYSATTTPVQIVSDLALTLLIVLPAAMIWQAFADPRRTTTSAAVFD